MFSLSVTFRRIGRLLPVGSTLVLSSVLQLATSWGANVLIFAGWLHLRLVVHISVAGRFCNGVSLQLPSCKRVRRCGLEISGYQARTVFIIGVHVLKLRWKVLSSVHAKFWESKVG